MMRSGNGTDLRITMGQWILALSALIWASPASAGIKIFHGLGTKEVIIIDKPTDEGILASIGGLDTLTLIPNFPLFPGASVFANIELAPAAASFATDGVSDLVLFTAFPITGASGAEWLATFDLDPRYQDVASIVGAFTFIESGTLCVRPLQWSV